MHAAAASDRLDPNVSPLSTTQTEMMMFPHSCHFPRRFVLAALVVTHLGTPLAHAQTRGNFDDADVNHDGRITLQEFESYTERYLMAGTGFRAQHFQQMSTQEQQAVLQKRFKQMDHANKGYLDRKDWTAS
jgi:Ca2+-binding EF-hand superfamily protein